MHPRGVIITRPEPGLSETMAAVADAGWLPLASPALVVQRYTLRLPKKLPAAILLTSGQAVSAVVAAAQQAKALDIPVYAVGDRTAQRARDAGFTHVKSADGDARALVALLQTHQQPECGSLLLCSGAGQGVELAAWCRQAGFKVVRRVVYAAKPIQHINAQTCTAIQTAKVAVVLFFSAESAAGWLAALPKAEQNALAAQARAVVISGRVAGVLRAAGWQNVRIADHVSAPAVMDALGAYPA
ncbi:MULTISPECIES: uroporphyrinogen-III synthase [Acetobacter]|uniref:Uroporphyrinogen-III synthase n=1 Tax=Acetobacter pasteurianus subsp. pasteurianus TaxID=481145 RepID=A0A1Y0Y3I5_ACEPA|nr:uroporphyrinogen-III synthase [Acetobacter pasteurianus]AKR48873.1 uroporphyrinogen-III synthase [Acetobacter pasteurianus]ARW46766.1 Uroporphyrinogen-III synthase [Acetobacter pasteurianus subsp. pasteurianus]